MNLLTAVVFKQNYFRPLLNQYHPNTTGDIDSCSIFSHMSEKQASLSSYDDIVFFERDYDETWTKVDVQPLWDTYYLMAKGTADNSWFFAPDLEGIPFYYRDELCTLKAINYGDRIDWELVKLQPKFHHQTELPRGNFWAH